MYKLIMIMLLVFSTIAHCASPIETPPKPGTPRDLVLPPKTVFELENGLKATLVPFGNLPKVAVRIVVRVGNLNETKDETWLADLAVNLMKEGTTSRSAEQIDRETAGMGGEFRISAGEDCTTLRGDVLSEFGPKLIELMADIIQTPLLPVSELPRLKRDLLRSIKIQKSQVNSLVHERFRSVMFRNHPYGRVFPTEEMMNGYQIDAVKSFYRSNFGACRTHVYVVGRFDENEIKIAISRFFGNWLAGKVSQVNVPHPVSQKAIHLIHRPDAVQSSIAVGLPVIDPSHEDHLSLILANALLGGATISRITQNIREDKGYTYNAYSEISTRYRNAYWVQTADVATEVTGAALQEIVHEIKRLSAESPPEEEVNKIKNFVSGLFVLRNSSPGGIISQLALLDLHGLDEDYLTSYVRNVHQVTPRDIQRVTIAYLKNDKMLIIVAGDREKICDQLLPFGLVIDR